MHKHSVESMKLLRKIINVSKTNKLKEDAINNLLDTLTDSITHSKTSEKELINLLSLDNNKN